MYFKNFEVVPYLFGNEKTVNVVQNLSTYVNLIDQVKDETSLYENYYILDGERPDVLSYKLYETTEYYWAFYILNDTLRRQGWPLSYFELTELVKKRYPNRTLVIREHLGAKFQVGETITGSTSGATGKILRRNLDLGQIVVKPTNTNTFQAEVITNTINGVTNSSTVTSTSLEYLSAHHYETTAGERVDIDPLIGPGGASLNEITYLNRYETENENLKKIKIFNRGNIGEVVTRFQSQLWVKYVKW